uniref:Uncharacterized protein n=1 Tax=Anguilla anguilla TaxID=7936 RepID=A0A0E9S293_ANGAN
MSTLSANRTLLISSVSPSVRGFKYKPPSREIIRRVEQYRRCKH